MNIHVLEVTEFSDSGIGRLFFTIDFSFDKTHLTVTERFSFCDVV